MSTIFVSVGQCGNQLSQSFIDYSLANQTQQTAYLFNHFDDKFHFINLDSEAKVINALSARYGRDLRSENLLNTKCGRGSNWASGYCGLEKDGASKFVEASLEAVRRESERCDFLLNFNLMHSLSGGTGSGCGSKMIERLREEFGGKKYMMTQSVAPFSGGELPLQHYNNLLCMSHLHEFVDCVCLFQNDDVFEILEKTAKDSQAVKPSVGRSSKPANKQDQSAGCSISLSEMNRYIVKSLFGAIMPVESVSLKNQSIGMEMYEIQRLLCSHKSMKFIELYNVNGSEVVQTTAGRGHLQNSHNSIKSNPLLKMMINQVPRYEKGLVKQFTSLNSLVVARGQGPANSLNTLWSDQDTIQKCLNPVSWNPFSMDFWYSKQALNELVSTGEKKSSFNKSTPTSLTFALNRNKCVEYLKEVRNKSAQKYVQKAYLHWFTKFGVDEAMFEGAFQNIQGIIDIYDSMCS